MPALSPREERVLISYLSGAPLKTTARQIGISGETARTYLQRIMYKFRAFNTVSTRSDVLALCYEGWGPWLMPPGVAPYPSAEPS